MIEEHSTLIALSQDDSSGTLFFTSILSTESPDKLTSSFGSISLLSGSSVNVVSNNLII